MFRKRSLQLTELAKQYGFESADELYTLYFKAYSVKDQESYGLFEKWLAEDRTKAGILELIVQQTQITQGG